MTPRNLTLPRYRHTVWCCNPACHAPVPAHDSECPECGEPVTRPVQHQPRSTEIDIDTLLEEGRY